MADQRLQDRLNRIDEQRHADDASLTQSDTSGRGRQSSFGWLIHWAVLGVVWGLVSMTLTLVIVVWYSQARAEADTLADNLDIVGALAGFAVLVSIGCRVLIGPIVLGRRGGRVILAGFVFGCTAAYLTLVEAGGNG